MGKLIACVLVVAACGSPRDTGMLDAPGAHGDGPHGDAPHGGSDGHTDSGGPGGVPAHIELYSGDGMMAMEGWPGGDQIKVLVTDANGQPVANVDVQWDVTAGDIAITGGFQTGQHGTTMTDDRGLARVGLRGANESQQSSAWTSVIRASIGVGSVDVHAFTTYYPMQLPNTPQPYVTTPDGRDFGTLAPGSVAAGGMVVQINFTAGSEMGHGVPGIGVRFIRSTDWTSDEPPIVSCANATVGLRAGGTVFTNAQGIATCDLRAPAVAGDYELGVIVGGATTFIPFSLHVH